MKVCALPYYFHRYINFLITQCRMLRRKPPREKSARSVQTFRQNTDLWHAYMNRHSAIAIVKGKGNPYSITECRVPELTRFLAVIVKVTWVIRLPLLSARSTVTLATLKRAATNFAARWTKARWVWTVCLRLLPSSVAAAIWTQAR